MFKLVLLVAVAACAASAVSTTSDVNCTYLVPGGVHFVNYVQQLLDNDTTTVNVSVVTICVPTAEYTGCGQGLSMLTGGGVPAAMVGLGANYSAPLPTDSNNNTLYKPLVDCQGVGRVFEIVDSIAVTVRNMAFSNGNELVTSNGGLLRTRDVVGGVDVTLIDVDVISVDDRAVYVYGAGNVLRVIGGSFVNNIEWAIYAYNGDSVELSGVQFAGNDGGGVYARFVDVIAFRSVNGSTSRTNNGAGGFSYIDVAQSVLVSNSSFERNIARWEAAALYVEDADIVVEGSAFYLNVAGSGVGLSTTNMDLLVDNATFVENWTDNNYNGGGIRCESESVVIRHSFFEANSCWDYEGNAVSIDNDATSSLIHDCYFVRNGDDNSYDGGALWLNADTVVRDCYFEDNTAQEGNVLETGSSVGVVLINLVAKGGYSMRAAAFNFPSGTHYVYNVTCEGTRSDSTSNGGGFFIGGAAIVYAENVTIANATLEGPAEGAGIYNSGSLIMYNSTITGCSCLDGSGGGVFSSETADLLELVSVNVSKNYASSYGGGMYLRSVIDITSVTAEGNVAGVGGGGIELVAPVGTFAGVTVIGNTALIGGGLRVFDFYLLHGTTVADNSATEGGGVWIYGTSTHYLVGVMITGNTASGHGGGIYTEDVDVTMQSCTVEGNTADVGGGCAFENSLYYIDLEATTVSDNSANVGGGVYIFENEPTLIDTTISGNSAFRGGGVWFDRCEYVAPENVRVHDNTATTGGGGVLWTSSDFDSPVNFTISENDASYGGGFLLDGGSVVIPNIVIENNKYSVGAVASVLAGDLTLDGTHLNNNPGSDVLVFASTSLTLSNIAIESDNLNNIFVQSADSVSIIDSSLVAAAAGRPLRLAFVTSVQLTRSMIGAGADLAMAGVCVGSHITSNDSVICADDGIPLQCTACTFTGDYTTCPNTRQDECWKECESSDFCLPEIAYTTAPNLGCPVCSGSCGNDTNSCHVNSTRCADTTQPPAYTCECGTGYVANANSTTACNDVDECVLDIDTCTGNSVCVNTDGSFVCSCPAGYEPDPETLTSCLEVDECAVGSPCGSAPDYVCTNTVGSFSCSCGTGYYVYDNNTDCRVCEPGWYTVGTTACVSSCPVGYNTVNSTCVDINECEITDVCGTNIRCTNTLGSYTCGGCIANTFVYDGNPTCRPCVPGRYIFSGIACLACPAGTVTTTAGEAVCVNCGLNGVANVNQSDCVCQPGFIPYGNITCYPDCALGEGAVAGVTCNDCGLGNYGVAPGICAACPPLSTTTITNATSLSDCQCVPGTIPAPGANSSFAVDGCAVVCGPGQYVSVANGLCLTCPRGTYSNSTSTATSCDNCPAANMFTPPTGATALDDCSCGDGQGVQNVEGTPTCVTWCEPGQSRPALFEPCEACGQGRYAANANQAACTLCPANTRSPPSATNIKQCECKAGYYTESKTTGVACRACPVGASCEGGTAQPVAEGGYYPTKDGSYVACSPPESCMKDGKCSTGYTGERCAVCASGFHRQSGYCRPCGAATTVAAVAAALGLVGVCAVLVSVNLNGGRFGSVGSVTIGLNALQILAQFGRLAIAWPPYVQTLFDILAAINLNVELVGPECAIVSGNPYLVRFVVMMLVPALMAVLLLVGYAVFKAWAACGRVAPSRAYEVRRAYMVSGLQLLLVLYLPLSVTVFEFFDCVPAGDVRVLASSPDVVCGGTAWNAVLPVALIFGVLYVVAAPVGLGAVLTVVRERVGNEAYLLNFGFLSNRYREEYYYYELIILFRKLGVAAVMTFGTASPYIQAGMGVVWLLAAFLSHHLTWPYAFRLNNWAEAACLFTVINILQFGVVFQDDTLSFTARGVIIVGALAVVLIVVTCSVVLEIQSLLTEKPTILAAQHDSQSKLHFYSEGSVGGSPAEELSTWVSSSSGVLDLGDGDGSQPAPLTFLDPPTATGVISTQSPTYGETSPIGIAGVSAGSSGMPSDLASTALGQGADVSVAADERTWA